jgi:predicted alpha/beta-hydrolase family hydrolase
MVLAHIAGIPVEETLMMAGPVLTTGAGVLVAELRSRRGQRRRAGRSSRRRLPQRGHGGAPRRKTRD